MTDNNQRRETSGPKLELGQAYVPYQKFDRLLSPEKALMSGTVFAELAKPYKK